MNKIFGLIVICFIVVIASGCAVYANSPNLDEGPRVIYSSGPISVTGNPAQPPSWDEGKGTYISEEGIITASVLEGEELVPLDAGLFDHPAGTCVRISRNGKVPIVREKTVYYLLLDDGQFEATEEKSAIGFLSGEVKEKRNNFVFFEAHLQGAAISETIYAYRWAQVCQ